MAKANKKVKTSSAAAPASTSKTASSSAGKSQMISGFHILPLSIPSTSSSSSSSSSSSTQHFLYLRPHKSSTAPSTSTSTASLPTDRTLFLVNVPTDATEAHLRSLFDKAGVGRVEEVRFAGQQTAFGDAAEQDAMLGVEEDQDDEDEDGEEAAAEEEDAEMQAATSATVPPSCNSKGKKGAPAKAPAGPPALVPLPSPLHPRHLLTTGSSAHVVFLEPSSVQLALDLCSSAPPGKSPFKWQDPLREAQRKAAKLAAGEDEDEVARKRKRPTTALEASLAASSSSAAPLGLELLLSTYDAHRPSSLESVKKHADSVVARRVWMTKRQRTQQGGSGGTGVRIASYGPNGEPLDEDGFTVVVAGGKYGRSGTGGDGVDGASAGPGSGGVKMARLRNAAKAKANGGSAVPAGLEDFYRFQVREEARQRIARLRKGFAEDARRMGELKATGGEEGGKAVRRFKPY